MLSLIFLILPALGFSQDYLLPLWPKNIPNSQSGDEIEQRDSTDIVRISNIQVPDIAVYIPSRRSSTGQAVVICPGGGYARLAYDLEGSDIAKLLNAHGIAAVVLKYRLPTSKSNIIGYKSPLVDAKRAIRLTRVHAEKWHIDLSKIGVMGFSAGGHLASTLGTHFDYGDKSASDSVETLSSRPDFMILIYPVITFTQSFMHRGSRDALLGENADSALVASFSNELQVTEQTPPTFLVHAGDDTSVPVKNSLAFYNALLENHVSAEMHIFPVGGHGFGLARADAHLGRWSECLLDWLSWLNRSQKNSAE
ncbi:alpha/beta hydrolase [candidate division KSB1 bacterium]|nr:alpha/beta hydrolase [candidate division KSB1 bacterium]